MLLLSSLKFKVYYIALLELHRQLRGNSIADEFSSFFSFQLVFSYLIAIQSFQLQIPDLDLWVA